jgi:elongation factor Ts
MSISAALVKKLRDETGAPMMECKAALEEGAGDYEKAKDLLREKGKAAATKRAGRATSAGRVAIATSSNHQAVGAVVLECETDFVSSNEKFAEIANELAELFLHNAPGADPLAVKKGDKTVADIIEGAVAVIRENIKLTQAIQLTSPNNSFATYVHHDSMKAVIVEVEGTPANGHDVGRKVAIQAVAYPGASFISKEDIPAEVLEKEISIEKARAMESGKPENIAENIARGKVNKEYVQQVALLEMPFYADSSKTVAAFIAEESKASPVKVVSFHRLAVGEGSEGSED